MGFEKVKNYPESVNENVVFNAINQLLSVN